MKIDRLLVPFAGLSFAGMAAAWCFAPGEVPLHWNAAGAIDSWGGKANLLWMGVLPLAFALFLHWLPRIDPKRDSWTRHAKTYDLIKVLLVVSLAAFGWVSAAVALGLPFDVSALVRVLVGLLLIGLGNVMGRLKRNYFVGIKTPWALADDEVWRLTHRRGGFVMVGLGLVFALSLFIPAGEALAAVLVVVGGGAFVYIVVYSYLAWRRLRGPAARAMPAAGDRPEPAGEKEMHP
jgi:uncharacterized membrane protein